MPTHPFTNARNRIDVHQHLLPPNYVAWLSSHGVDAAGGRTLPDWSIAAALRTMDDVGTASAILSISTPGTTPARTAAEAVRVASDVNDFAAEVAKDRPDRFGFFASVPLTHTEQATAEAVRALDESNADGVVLLANNGGAYLGRPEHEDLFAELDRRHAVAFIHPADLPGPAVPGIPPFAADFLLDTTRAAYLLVRNGVRRRYPNIRFVLSHGGGFVPYASHRMALGMFADTGRSLLDILEDFSTFYFDTALSASAVALPSLLAFAAPGHVLFGSDWPFAPGAAVQYMAAGLDTYAATSDSALGIDRDNAAALFPRFATAPTLTSPNYVAHARRAIKRRVVRAAVKFVAPS
ncbi:amidohydrolase family protein [Antrihabitans sp. YC2-6]|uniref:amidohydrolase family protein n=1 Tax=Antrihabitans sp. YC2-6 TaxID=2799498 RepID=UPI0018F29ECB|nr:amidohydrolase family protein [Antrihabitans sp. YC2-6]MBJ8343841.1 amidohydrolase [Antrihabitans sp. YC2-6]